MIEAQLTAGLMMLFLKVLEKGIDNVIDAGYKDAAQGVKNLLKGSQAEQEMLRLQGIVEKLAKESFANGKEGDLFSHKPFLQQMVSVIVDPLFDYDFDQLGEAYVKKFENHPQLKDDIKRFIKNLEKILIKDQYWGDVIERFRQIRDNHEIKQKLEDLQLPVRESKIVSQEITHIDTNIEHIETFIEQFTIENFIENQNNVSIVINETKDFEGERLAEKTRSALNHYLSTLLSFCYRLPLAPLGDDHEQLKISLNDVYINLNTTAELVYRKELIAGDKSGLSHSTENGIVQKFYEILDKNSYEEKSQRYKTPVTAYLAAQRYASMVLLGGPGSGKSTFVKYLLGQYITNKLALEGFESGLFPIFISFRNISKGLFEQQINNKPTVEQEKILVRTLKQQIQEEVFADGCCDLEDFFEEKWRQGDYFLVLDGLDEVPEEQREVMRKTVVALRNLKNKPKRLLITCRVRSYIGEAVLPEIQGFTLASLNNTQINLFINQWYEKTAAEYKLSEEETRKRTDNLKNEAKRDSLIELSRNPMLLTTMTLIHQRDAILPDQRVKVYKLAVDILVKRWQTIKGDGDSSTELKEFLKQDERVIETLGIIAYHAHRSQKGDLDRYELIKILEEDARLNIGFIDAFLKYIDQRSGLITGLGSAPGKPTRYSFPHRTFQEYLAGCYLVRQENIEQLLDKLAGEKDRWYLPVQYAFEYLYFYELRGKLLLKALRDGWNQDFQKDDAIAQRRLLWAGCITRIFWRDFMEKEKEVAQQNPSINQLKTRLVKSFGLALIPKEWVEAGEILVEIGDPRFYGEELFYLPKDENLGFVEVPAGKFWMGEKNEMYQVELPTYYLSKFMVTVDQFRFFSEMAKYTKFNQDALKDKNNQPVRFMTWYNAIEYCSWMQEQLIKSADTPAWMREKLDQGWRITLPSEAEWEKAARGNTQNKYPWGNEINPEDANYHLTQIGGPSTVGCFPGHGLGGQFYDLSGNLWDWTRSLWGEKFDKPDFEYPYLNTLKQEDLDAPKNIRRVRRGGSFLSDEDFLRCAYRYRNNPSLVSLDFSGFRIVLSPPPLDSGPSG